MSALNPRQFEPGVYQVHPSELQQYRQHDRTSDFARETYGRRVVQLMLSHKPDVPHTLTDGNHALNAALESGAQSITVRAAPANDPRWRWPDHKLVEYR
jgi:hypothetical protein